MRAEAERLEPGAEETRRYRLAGRVLGRRGHGKLVSSTWSTALGASSSCATKDARTRGRGPGRCHRGRRRAGRTKRGEPSLAVSELEPLAKSKRPLPDTSTGSSMLRLATGSGTSTYSSTRRRAATSSSASRIVAAIRRYLDAHGFVEVETPVRTRYGGAFAQPFVTHSNELDADLYLGSPRALPQAADRRRAREGLRDGQGLSQRERLQAPAGFTMSGTRRIRTTGTRWSASRTSCDGCPRDVTTRSLRRARAPGGGSWTSRGARRTETRTIFARWRKGSRRAGQEG